jgi:3-hydroxyacyl-[acyl-carrier-protein] dehydratase
MENQIISFNTMGIMSCQQNRFPMLFIDQVTECLPRKYAKGYKLFSYNEWYFHGYDTLNPKVWNVIQIEAMSQMFLMTFLSIDDMRGHVAMSYKFDNVNFIRKISPGDRLNIEANLISFGRGVARGEVKGYVDNNLACSMECTIVIPDLFVNRLGSSPEKVSLNNENISNKLEVKVDFGIEKIRECLLNKYPWLFIDKVLDIEPGKYVEAIKNYTYNEHYFPAHFPDDPSVPGFIQIETCMQAFLLTFLSLDSFKRLETADRSLKNVSVRRKIVPGECLQIFATLDSLVRGIARGKVESFVDGEPAISFEITAVILDEFNKYMPQLKK